MCCIFNSIIEMSYYLRYSKSMTEEISFRLLSVSKDTWRHFWLSGERLFDQSTAKFISFNIFFAISSNHKCHDSLGHELILHWVTFALPINLIWCYILISELFIDYGDVMKSFVFLFLLKKKIAGHNATK